MTETQGSKSKQEGIDDIYNPEYQQAFNNYQDRAFKDIEMIAQNCERIKSDAILAKYDIHEYELMVKQEHANQLKIISQKLCDAQSRVFSKNNYKQELLNKIQCATAKLDSLLIGQFSDLDNEEIAAQVGERENFYNNIIRRSTEELFNTQLRIDELNICLNANSVDSKKSKFKIFTRFSSAFASEKLKKSLAIELQRIEDIKRKLDLVYSNRGYDMRETKARTQSRIVENARQKLGDCQVLLRNEASEGLAAIKKYEEKLASMPRKQEAELEKVLTEHRVKIANQLREVKYSDDTSIATVKQFMQSSMAVLEENDTEAIYQIGVAFQQGLQVEHDYVHAVHWFIKGANLNDPECQYAFADALMFGKGVAKDEKHAVEWHIKAADRGHAKSQFRLGKTYQHGNGIQRDIELAFLYFKMSAEQGHIDAARSVKKLEKYNELGRFAQKKVTKSPGKSINIDLTPTPTPTPDNAGIFGEESVRSELRKIKGTLLSGFIRSNNIKYCGENFQIDFLLFIPKIGLVVVEVKCWKGTVKASSERKWTQESPDQQRELQNASIQVLRTRGLLLQILDKGRINNWPIKALVVFAHPTAKILKSNKNEPQTDIILKTMISSWIEENSTIGMSYSFSKEDFSKVKNVICQYTTEYVENS